MMRPGAEVVVFLCVQPVDMPKQAAGLALLIEQSLDRSVFELALYVFSNRRHDRVRIVYWERNGLCKPSTENPQHLLRTQNSGLSVALLARAQRSDAQGFRPGRVSRIPLHLT